MLLPDWNSLPDDIQLALSKHAFARAVDLIAGQAECLAGEMEKGELIDRGGPDALRLLAAVIRVTSQPAFPEPVGSA